jgi:hypothetical protein
MSETDDQIKLEQKSWADLLVLTPPGGMFEVSDFSYITERNQWCLSLQPAFESYSRN